MSSRSKVPQQNPISQSISVEAAVNGTTSAASAAVAKSADEARLPGIAKHSVMRKSDLELSSAEAGLLGSRPDGTTSAADDTAVAQSACEIRLPDIAKHSAVTASVLAVSAGEDGSSCPGATGTTDDAATAVVMSAGEVKLALHGPEQKARPVPPLRQSQNQPIKLGLLRSAVPRQNPNSQSLPMKLGLRGSEQKTQPVPMRQQSQTLLSKLGLLRTMPRRHLNSQCNLMMLGLRGREQRNPDSKRRPVTKSTGFFETWKPI